MRVVTLVLGGLKTNAYLAAGDADPDALLVDPVAEPDRLIAAAARHGLRIVAMACTHSHYDHFAGAAGVAERLGVPFLVGAAALDSLRAEPGRALRDRGVVVPPPPEPARLLREGDVVAAGSLRFTVLDTPGHWRGDISLYAPAERAVFTGDALFRRAIGRFNPGCDIPTLLHSVRTRLLTLPDETVVYPGHGRATTIGDERRHNRSLHDYRDD